MPSTVSVEIDPGAPHLKATTENVARLSFDLPFPTEVSALDLDIDGQALAASWPENGVLSLGRVDGTWQVASPDPGAKSPARSGPFKDAFRRHFLGVVGTTGTEEENAWALARARHDAETFWYRGNGAFDLVRDVDFDPAAEPDRGVVLYGNVHTNAAYAALLDGCPVQVGRGGVQVGERELGGDDLAALVTWPRPGSSVACVALVGGTGLAGLHATDFLPYFVSGVAYPDWALLGVEFLEQGAAGVRAAGFFDDQWRLSPADSAFREE